MISGLTLSRVPTGNVSEGSNLALTVAWSNGVADDHIVVVDWGDGTVDGFDVPSSPPTYSEVYNHTYATWGEFDILVDVSVGTDVALAGLPITVVAVAPVITVATGTCDNDSGVTDINFTFTDPGLAGFDIVVYWGDGLSDSWYVANAGTYSRSHTYTSFPSGSFTHRRLIQLFVADRATNTGSSLFYPIMTFNDDVDDVGIGTVDGHAIIEYHDTVDKTGIGNTFFDGIPFYSFDADGTGSAAASVSSVLDHASVLIIADVVECSQVGNTPFEQLVPPE